MTIDSKNHQDMIHEWLENYDELESKATVLQAQDLFALRFTQLLAGEHLLHIIDTGILNEERTVAMRRSAHGRLARTEAPDYGQYHSLNRELLYQRVKPAIAKLKQQLDPIVTEARTKLDTLLGRERQEDSE